MWYKISLQKKKKKIPLKTQVSFVYLCISDTYRTFPMVPFFLPLTLSLSLLCRPDAPALSLLIHISAAYLHRAPQWDFNHCDMRWKQRLSVSCAGEIEIGRREKRRTKGREGGRGRRWREVAGAVGGGGKVNIILFLTPWDRKQPPHTVKV